MAPSATDQQLAERIDGLSRTLADFRVEVSERFGGVDAHFAAIETELAVIRKLGTWLLGGVFGLVAALITGAATVGWSASAVVSEARQQSRRIDGLDGRIDRVEERLGAIDRKLDTLIGRAATKAEKEQ